MSVNISILDKIVAAAKLRVTREKAACPQIKPIAPTPLKPFAFEAALAARDISFICEVKKASPSKGLIAKDFRYLDIAKEYEEAGAAAISVLTEPDFFMGSDTYLSEIRGVVNIPLLRKDFTVDAYQLHQAAALGADAVLLICAVLSEAELKEFIQLADSLGLSCLVEAHDDAEVSKAISAGARVIGVNNRNLHNFEVDLNNSIRLRKLVPDNIVFVSESGINCPKDIAALNKCGVNAVLVGESLMRSADKNLALKELRGSL